MPLPSGYRLRLGSSLDQALLLKVLQQTYKEFEPREKYSHLAQTVEQYLSRETPLWWVELNDSRGETSSRSFSKVTQPVACLWLGTAINQLRGNRHAHIFLLYVSPEHRRKGIGAALMAHAEDWARSRGDQQIGLKVFQANRPALNLYQQLGFQTQSLWMVKQLNEESGSGQ